MKSFLLHLIRLLFLMLLSAVAGADWGYDRGFRAGEADGFVKATDSCTQQLGKVSKTLNASWGALCGIELMTRDCVR